MNRKPILDPLKGYDEVKADLRQQLADFPDYEHPHPPAMFSDRFKTFLGVGILMGAVFTIIHYFHVRVWP